MVAGTAFGHVQRRDRVRRRSPGGPPDRARRRRWRRVQRMSHPDASDTARHEWRPRRRGCRPHVAGPGRRQPGRAQADADRFGTRRRDDGGVPLQQNGQPQEVGRAGRPGRRIRGDVTGRGLDAVRAEHRGELAGSAGVMRWGPSASSTRSNAPASRTSGDGSEIAGPELPGGLRIALGGIHTGPDQPRLHPAGSRHDLRPAPQHELGGVRRPGTGPSPDRYGPPPRHRGPRRPGTSRSR